MKSKIDLEKTLLPALVQCFGIMFIGYILGKTKILRHKEANGLSLFVRYLALPSLIFVTISTISFKHVKWEFIAAVFVAKSFIFLCVALMTIILNKPVNLGKSGIFAMAATQSNDFALGYPLLVSLYSTTHPEYPSYLYIIAPIQLFILNTIGFFFMEVEKKNNNERKFFYVLRSTLANPIVFATIVAMIWNLTYGQKILPIFDATFKTFSSAFAATALVLVGYTMAEESEYSDNHISLTVTLLVITKNLILPLILQKFSTFLLQGSTVDEIESFSSFGFLYGTIPTAPSVYVFSIQYGMSVNIITKTIIGSTIVSAPLMFASASVISLSQTGIENLGFFINQMIAYLSSIAFFCSLWLLLLFMIEKKWKSIYLSPIFQLIFLQILVACGGLILFFEPTKDSTLFHVRYVLTVGAIYGTRFSAAFLSILLFILRWRSLCYILRVKNVLNFISFTFCLILPFVIAGTTLKFTKFSNIEPPFHLSSQLVVTAVITTLCLVLTLLFLILQHVCFRTIKNTDSSRALFYENAVLYQNAEMENEQNSSESDKKQKNEAYFFTDVEDLGKHLIDESLIEESVNSVPQNSLCDSRFQCSSQQRLQCASQVSEYINSCEDLESNHYANKSIFKHTILLIALCVIMTLNLSVCIWKLLKEELSGIFIELEYLDIIGNYSQGIICFVLFGLDNKLIELIRIKCKKMIRSKNMLDINEATTPYICNHFMTFLEKCKIDIGQTKTINNMQCKHAFSGIEFVEWLLENAVVEKIEEAEAYGSHLLKGHIIGSINFGENLTQHPYLYRFLV